MTHRALIDIPTLKAVMVTCIGIWALLVGLDNLLDYAGNWQFVQHVLAMDTVFPDNQTRWRAITDPLAQRLAYGVIIAWEWLIAVCCLFGAWRLLRSRKDRAAFMAAKPLAAAGLVGVFILYFFGFVTIGGEWFSMWQSSTWNGQQKAAMFCGIAMAVLIVLLMPEEAAL